MNNTPAPKLPTPDSPDPALKAIAVHNTLAELLGAYGKLPTIYGLMLQDMMGELNQARAAVKLLTQQKQGLEAKMANLESELDELCERGARPPEEP